MTYGWHRQGGSPESRGQREDRSRLRTVEGEQRLRTVEEVESKEWRQEDASRMHPQGLMGVRVLEVEPRPVGGD